jgi:predicted RND superfamily exporter protein
VCDLSFCHEWCVRSQFLPLVVCAISVLATSGVCDLSCLPATAQVQSGFVRVARFRNTAAVRR